MNNYDQKFIDRQGVVHIGLTNEPETFCGEEVATLTPVKNPDAPVCDICNYEFQIFEQSSGNEMGVNSDVPLLHDLNLEDKNASPLDPEPEDEGCWFCQDTGEVACPDCEDDPVGSPCLRCEGTRNVECPECHGSGESQDGLAEIGRVVLENHEISENPEILRKFRDGLDKKHPSTN